MIFSGAPATDRYLVCTYTCYINGNSDRLLLSWSPISLQDGDCSHAIKRHLLLAGKAMMNLDSKNQRHHFAYKGPYSQSYCFSTSPVPMWELDHKQAWGGVTKSQTWLSDWTKLYLLCLRLRLTILSKEVFQIPSRKPYIDIKKKK